MHLLSLCTRWRIEFGDCKTGSLSILNNKKASLESIDITGSESFSRYYEKLKDENRIEPFQRGLRPLSDFCQQHVTWAFIATTFGLFPEKETVLSFLQQETADIAKVFLFKDKRSSMYFDLYFKLFRRQRLLKSLNMDVMKLSDITEGRYMIFLRFTYFLIVLKQLQQF